MINLHSLYLVTVIFKSLFSEFCELFYFFSLGQSYVIILRILNPEVSDPTDLKCNEVKNALFNNVCLPKPKKELGNIYLIFFF